MPFGTGGEFTGGGSGGGGGPATSVTAGDASLVISPNTGAIVATTGTLDQIANLHAAVANWSNNGNAITGLSDIALTGLTGATNATRFVGGTTSGHPSSGTFNTGDFVIDATGVVWVCTSGGSPGTWTNAGSSSTLVAATGETGATAAVKFVGGTISGAPVTGTFNTGDYIIDRTGFIWICTSGGSPGTWVQPSVSSLGSLLELSLTTTVPYDPNRQAGGNLALLIVNNVTSNPLPPVTAMATTTTTYTGSSTTIAAINLATTMTVASNSGFISTGGQGVIQDGGATYRQFTYTGFSGTTIQGVVISGPGANTISNTALVGFYTITFASTILGTQGQIGDKFRLYTRDFSPSGWNVGSTLNYLQAVVASSTSVTIGTYNASPGSVTTYGQAINYNSIIYNTGGGYGGPPGEVNLQGVVQWAETADSLDGAGPGFQTQVINQNVTPVSVSGWSFSSGSNSASVTGDHRAGIVTAMNVADTTTPSSVPANANVGAVSYNGTSTTITLFYKTTGTAANFTANSGGGGDTLSFSSDIPGRLALILGDYIVGNGAAIMQTPMPSGSAQPGNAAGWYNGIEDAVAFGGINSGSIGSIYHASATFGIQVGVNSWAPFSSGLLLADSNAGPVSGYAGAGGGTVAMRNGIGIGNFSGTLPQTVVNQSSATALSALSGTLTVLSTSGFASQGSASVQCSDGVHTFTWTGTTGTTFTGCSFSGSQSATVINGYFVNSFPTLDTWFGAVSNVGIWNTSTTFNPAQPPMCTVASGSNGVNTSNIGFATTANQSGQALSSLSTLTVSNSSTFPTSGTGTIVCSDGTHIFTWSGNNGSTQLTGCVYTGYQSATVSTGAVHGATVLNTSSVEWFPDQGGTVKVSIFGGNYAVLTYGFTTSTFVTGNASAVSLTTLAGTFPCATSMMPVAGSGTLMTNLGPLSVSWTGIGSTGLTGFTTGSNTVINGSQLFLTSTSTGPTGLGPAFANLTLSSGSGTFVTGQTVIGQPGGTFQALSLPAEGNLLCVGPGFTLPAPISGKMSIVSKQAATAATAAATIGGLLPPYDGQELKIVVPRVPSAATITFGSNGTDNGTNLALGAGTRAVTVGGMLVLSWDQAGTPSGSLGYIGQWIEVSASNLGSHG